VNQFAQRAIVRAKTIGGIESARARSAEPADTFFIQREMILKRRAAAYAKVIGRNWSDARQARGANGNAREFGQRSLADAAFIGKNERKKAIGGLAENGGEGDQRT
jgi:hypothetical protein